MQSSSRICTEEPDTAGFSGVSTKRAATLNAKTHKRSADDLQASKRSLFDRLQRQYGDKFSEMRTNNMGALWREFVKNKVDAEAFMEIMYPQFPKEVQLAYVHMFERAVNGEIQLDGRLLFDKDNQTQETWDPIKDIEQERTAGLVNLTTRRLDQLLADEEIVTTTNYQPRPKKKTRN